MRGRKHPLEIFRENGGEFSIRRRSRDEPGVDALAESRADPPAESRKPRRNWDARAMHSGRTPPAPRSAGKPGRRSASTPLWRAAAAVGALVLVVGAAYALKLWPAGSKGASGQDGTPLEKSGSILEHWRDLVSSPSRGTGADSGAEGGRGAAESEKDAAARANGKDDHAGHTSSGAGPGIEAWLQVASVKLAAKDDKKWIERFRPDRLRLEKMLGNDFPGMSVQLLESPKGDEGMLCIGPGATPDDPALERLKAKVRALDEHFRDATVKKFKQR